MKEKHSLREQGTNYGGFFMFYPVEDEVVSNSKMALRELPAGIDCGFIRLLSCSIWVVLK